MDTGRQNRFDFRKCFALRVSVFRTTEGCFVSLALRVDPPCLPPPSEQTPRNIIQSKSLLHSGNHDGFRQSDVIDILAKPIQSPENYPLCMIERRDNGGADQ